MSGEFATLDANIKKYWQLRKICVFLGLIFAVSFVSFVLISIFGNKANLFIKIASSILIMIACSSLIVDVIADIRSIFTIRKIISATDYIINNDTSQETTQKLVPYIREMKNILNSIN